MRGSVLLPWVPPFRSWRFTPSRSFAYHLLLAGPVMHIIGQDAHRSSEHGLPTRDTAMRSARLLGKSNGTTGALHHHSSEPVARTGVTLLLWRLAGTELPFLYVPPDQICNAHGFPIGVDFVTSIPRNFSAVRSRQARHARDIVRMYRRSCT